MKKWLLPALLLLASQPLWAETAPAPQAAQGSQSQAALVVVAPVKQGTLTQQYEAAVTLTSARRVTLTAQAAGPIQQLLAQSGDDVKKGQLLLTIAHPALEAQIKSAAGGLQAAQANALQAKDALNRQKRLLQAGYITPAALETAKSASAAAEGQRKAAAGSLSAAKAGLTNYQVKAPFAGRILRHFDLVPGAEVAPGTPLFDLCQMTGLEAKFAAPAALRRTFSRGEKATLTIDGLKTALTGSVTALSPYIDPASRTFEVTVTLDDSKEGDVLPGDFGTLRVTTESGQGLIVPLSALQKGDEKTRVAVVEGEKAIFKEVQTGLQNESHVLVTSGLREGALIITRGAEALKDGDPVKILRRENIDAN